MRLIQKWPNAGVLEKGKRTSVEAGSQRGGSASPLLASAVVHNLENRRMRSASDHLMGGLVEADDRTTQCQPTH